MENIKRPAYALAIAIALAGLLYVYGNVDPESSQWGRFFPKCIVKTITGFQCPSCGVQRAAHALLQGDLMGAMRQNWFLLFSLSYLLGLLITRYCGAPFSRLRLFFWGKQGCTLYVTLYVIWFIVRNILRI